MGRALARSTGQPHVSSKLHRHAKKQAGMVVELKDIQKSLAGIGVSLSCRVIEGRAKR